MHQAQTWQPSNINEFFFCDDNGVPTISEERVKILYYEFTNMMKDVYANISKKYTDIVATIIADPDLEGVNFPLVIEKMNVEGLKAFLAEDIAKKLDLTEEYDFN